MSQEDPKSSKYTESQEDSKSSEYKEDSKSQEDSKSSEYKEDSKSQEDPKSSKLKNYKLLVVAVLVAVFAALVVFLCTILEEQQPMQIGISHPPCFMNNTAMIEHVKDKLKLHTQNATGMYYLVEGPHGCGKTTALRYAAEAIGDNIAYVTVDHSADFGMSLANALSIDLGCKESPTGVIPVKKKCPETLGDRVKRCLNELEQIQEEGNSVPILIIDNVDILVDENSSVVFTLQAFAKRMADERLLTIYFVSSEGKFKSLLLQKSASSRMVTFPHHKWELSKEEAVRYLHCQCPHVLKDTITKIVDIVGGYFTHLSQVNEIPKSTAITVDNVKNQLFFINVISKLKELDISETPPTSKTGHALTDVTWSLAKKLLVATNNMIRFEEDNLWKKLSSDEKNKLERVHIFDIDEIKQRITFQSTLVHSYFKEVIEREETDSQGVCASHQCESKRQ